MAEAFPIEDSFILKLVTLAGESLAKIKDEPNFSNIVEVTVDAGNGTLSVSDAGPGMTSREMWLWVANGNPETCLQVADCVVVYSKHNDDHQVTFLSSRMSTVV